MIRIILSTLLVVIHSPMLLPTWSELSGSGSGFGVSNDPASSHQRPCLALDSGGQPIVAWEAINPAFGTNDIRVIRWDGVAWVGLNGSSAPDGISFTPTDSLAPSMEINPITGNQGVAWSEFTGANFEVYFREWDGVSWQELGGSATGLGISSTADPSTDVSLAYGSSGLPWIAWREQLVGGSQIYLRHWNGIAWAETVGSATGNGISNSPGPNNAPSLRVFGLATPHVAYENFTTGIAEVSLKFFDGVSWTGLGGSDLPPGLSNSPGMSLSPWLVLDGVGNPQVAWSDDSGGSPAIYFRRWTGATWGDLSNSGTGLGLSQTIGPATDPALALDILGNPVVAWTDGASGNLEILVRRWDGATWADFAGSGLAAGMTANGGASVSPSLGVNSTGDPFVAWSDTTSGGQDVLLALFTPPPPPPPPLPFSNGIAVSEKGGECPSCRCGLLGMEAVMLMLFVFWLRRELRR